MVTLGVLKETSPFEERVALTPEVAQKLIKAGYQVMIETGAGLQAGFVDDEYHQTGAVISKKEDVLKSARIVMTVSPLSENDLSKLSQKTIVLGAMKLHTTDYTIPSCVKNKLTCFALERLPRITRAQSMDILSSQSNLAGYRAVIEGCVGINRSFPLMMTAAGTIRPAKVLVLGAGVAGLQAIATAKRLGAMISAFDVRASTKEQVESLGATFVEVDAQENGENASGYASEMSEAYKQAQTKKLKEVILIQDVVITTALIPGKKAPVLITKDMVDLMKPGSVIVDLASENGGNCVLSQHGKTIVHKNTTIIAPYNILSHISYDASQTFSRNLLAFITTLFRLEGDQIQFDQQDEIIQSTLIVKEGEVVHEDYVNSTPTVTEPSSTDDVKKPKIVKLKKIETEKENA